MARRREPIRRQKPVRGGRVRVSTAVIARIQEKVESEASKYNCSKSMVEACAMARGLKITLDEYYDIEPVYNTEHRLTRVK